MRSLPVINESSVVRGPSSVAEDSQHAAATDDGPRTTDKPRRLPDWLKKPLPKGNENFFTHDLLRELRLETVCENARCPNRPECYSRRTATFMILGNVCT